MKSLKTPLRYPGGKSRATKKIGPYIPDLRDYDEFIKLVGLTSKLID